MMFLRVVPPGQPRISRAGPSRGPPGQRPREGVSGCSPQRGLSPVKTKRKLSLRKSPNFVDFVVV